VHQHDIGPKRLRELDRLLAIASPARDYQATVRLQQLPERLGKGIVVFDDKHPPTVRADVPSSPRVRHRTKVTISRRHRGVSGLPRSPAGRTRAAVGWE